MMKDFGGPLKGGMPLYKYVGNRVLTAFENRALGLNLTEFHSGYRAYNVHALRQIKLDKLTNDFHFDTEIIIKLHHQNFRIKEVPIPTFYGDEICRVNGLKYAKAIVRAVKRYTETVRSVCSFPEYEEYFVPYPMKRSRYSAHHYALQLVGTRHRVLDVGSGDEAFGAELAKAGNEVTGVGSGDLNSGLGSKFGRPSDPFDAIVMLDRLEHVKDPTPLLEDCRRLLAPRGRLIVSVPNAVNLTVRLAVLFGRFDYADRGILDWSHVRFFTRKTIRRMLARHGYHVTSVHSTTVPLERLIPLAASSWVMRAGNRALRVATTLLPGLFAYEILLVAER